MPTFGKRKDGRFYVKGPKPAKVRKLRKTTEEFLKKEREAQNARDHAYTEFYNRISNATDQGELEDILTDLDDDILVSEESKAILHDKLAERENEFTSQSEFSDASDAIQGSSTVAEIDEVLDQVKKGGYKITPEQKEELFQIADKRMGQVE
jgi:Fic family protein